MKLDFLSFPSVFCQAPDPFTYGAGKGKKQLPLHHVEWSLFNALSIQDWHHLFLGKEPDFMRAALWWSNLPPTSPRTHWGQRRGAMGRVATPVQVQWGPWGQPSSGGSGLPGHTGSCPPAHSPLLLAGSFCTQSQKWSQQIQGDIFLLLSQICFYIFPPVLHWQEEGQVEMGFMWSNLSHY